MTTPRTYPHGVPSWIDTGQPDPERAQAFYGRLLGWTVERVSPDGTPYYAIASLAGRDVGGFSESAGEPVWNTYVAVDDAEQSARDVVAAGGSVIAEPFVVGPAGSTATCRDPAGAEFRLWQAGRRVGAQVVNEPGSWNFSDLHTDRPETIDFYARVFGWEVQDLGFATMLRVPGYGAHLEATVDPGIRERQAGVVAPVGFEDAIAWLAGLEDGTTPHWHVTIAVADRDATAARARELGAEVLGSAETPFTRTALIRDPVGAVFTTSQFTPPQEHPGFDPA